MKQLLTSLCILISLQSVAQTIAKTDHLFIITMDGCRWQEIFQGADSALINNPDFVHDTSLEKAMYWDTSTVLRRKKLMPFFWSVLQSKGQLWGNRDLGNKSDVRNIFKISYPGYNEILTGYADPRFIPNTPVNNANLNILEYLNTREKFKGRVVAFSSWDVFPYILNRDRNKLNINSGYALMDSDGSDSRAMINKVQDQVAHKTKTRYDLLTFINAFDYIKASKPAIVLLGLGETDEFAHQGKYDSYLQQMNAIDKMIAELWYFVQTDPEYRDHTSFIITTDHGRGKGAAWHTHGTFTKGSGETWVAFLGAGIEAKGEMAGETQIYQNQLAASMAALLGVDWHPLHATGRPISSLLSSSVPEKQHDSQMASK